MREPCHNRTLETDFNYRAVAELLAMTVQIGWAWDVISNNRFSVVIMCLNPTVQNHLKTGDGLFPDWDESDPDRRHGFNPSSLVTE
jgi:hypothetical protein